MNKDTKSIKLIELVPYGSFPVSRISSAAELDIAALSAFHAPKDLEKANFWFESDEVEVA